MKGMILGMLAETSVHPGAGRTVGFVDMPVAREAVTDYPVIVGSSLKGTLRSAAREKLNDANGKFDLMVENAFGKHDDAGALVVSDGRLLLLPVRSLTGQYKWATCPYILERYSRDLKRIIGNGIVSNVKVDKGKLLTNGLVKGKKIFLEEREFEVTGNVHNEIIEKIKEIIPHEETKKRVDNQIVILSDDDFNWFAKYGLAINARNVLNENKTSDNLWYEETLPTDSVFYAILFWRKNSIKEVEAWLNGLKYLQVGGNET
jgi:CRISPR-associated protein Cmr4